MATSTNSTTAPVTTPAGLGFASRAEAFARARDACRTAEEGPALDAAAEAEYAAAEALIETPAATPAQIAEKLTVLMETHNSGGTGQDLGMKSIRRDLIALDAAQTETRDDADLAGAEAALSALYADHANAVRVFAANRPNAFSPAAFLADLLAHDVTVLASPSGKLELLAHRTVLDRDGGGYREVPRHPDADAMKARFDTLTDSERAALSDYVCSLPR